MAEKTVVFLGMEAVGKSLLVGKLRDKCANIAGSGGGSQGEGSGMAAQACRRPVPATTPTVRCG